MAITDYILYAFVYILEMLISLSFFSSIYEKKRSNKAIYLIGTVLFIAGSVLFCYFENEVLNLIVFLIINIVFSYVCYDMSAITSFVNSVLLDALMLFTEMIAIMLVTSLSNVNTAIYKSNYNYLIIILLICKTLYFVCSQLLCLVIKKTTHKHINSKKFLPLFIFPIISTISSVIYFITALSTDIDDSLRIAFAVISALNVLACLFIFMYFQTLESNQEELNKLKSIEQKQEIDKKYMDILEQNNKDLKMFTHDIKNHLEQISNLSEDPEIRQYVSKLYGAVNQYSYAGISDNKVLDVIIGKYNTLCQSKKINISFDAKTANLSFIDNTDLSTILNNLLDNAVESAENSGKRRISVSIFSKGNFMQVLRISNSCDYKPATVKTSLVTSKKNKELHGLGILSVNKAIKKYDGVFDWQYDEANKIFEVTVIFSTT